MAEQAPRKTWGHLMELGAIALIAAFATVAVYAWLFPAMAIATPCGIVIGVVAAAGLAFLRIYRRYGFVRAVCSSLGVAALSGYLALFGLLNLLGA